jgi:hypothetical protein
VWLSSDINAGTPSFSQVTSYPFRQPERVLFNPFDSNEVWVTSFGNGMKVGYLNNPSGIADFSMESFNIFPNPSNGYINIQLNTTANIWVDMIDINGKKVLNYLLKPGINTFDVSTLANGVYTIGANGRFKKVLIAH